MENTGFDSIHERPLSDHWPDDDSDFGEHDIAITHDGNSKLKGRSKVEQFFKDVHEHKSLANLRTRRWLGSLPFDMCEEAIPLFVDEASSTDYQLHPCYTWLELGKAARLPHAELFRLSINDQTLDVPNIVMGIGRLFFNSSNGKAERTSRWTGYEVFVDKELALWMVFDRQSTEHPIIEWYPLGCGLSDSNSSETGSKHRDYNNILKEPMFDIACFLSSLPDIADAKYGTAVKKVRETSLSGKMKVDQMERREIDKSLETKLAPQENESTAALQQPLLPAGETLDSHNLDEIRQEVNVAILYAVRDAGGDGHMLVKVLDDYKDDIGMIRKVITEKVVKEAAGNEHCGSHIMTTLFDHFKDEVGENISEGVIKAAAGNWSYGMKIMETLLSQCEEVVCKNVSASVIKAAAENKGWGGPILNMLLKVCREKVEKLIIEVFDEKDESPLGIRKSLKNRLMEAHQWQGRPAIRASTGLLPGPTESGFDYGLESVMNFPFEWSEPNPQNAKPKT